MARDSEKIGLVLSGGGARGAYEFGVLSVLLPALEQRPNVILGTSVGAINAAYVAANAHRPLSEMLEDGRKLWLEASWEDVLKPLIAPATALSGARYAGAVAGIPGVDLHSLLDPAPLQGTLESWIDWDSIHRNVEDGTVDSLSVVATSAINARSAVFVESRQDPPSDSSYEIDYIGTRLEVQHVRASAAIPVVFPAVDIDTPEDAAGYYFDGGTRLNTPLKPAIDLGVDRVIILATHSVDPTQDGNWHTPGELPDFGDAAVQFLFAALVDSLIADVKMLGKINLLAGDQTELLDDYRGERGRMPVREIPYIFVSPPSRDRLGDIAYEIFGAHYDKIRGFLRSTNIAALGRLMGGVTEPHGELLSYLMFVREFSEAIMKQGEEDARRWLERDWGEDGPWMHGPIDTLKEEAAER
ncbi:MAG: patatin-like phospholipase family protein [Solirubrobacterales bacterium]